MKRLRKVLVVLTLVVSALAVVKMGSAQSARRQSNIGPSSPPAQARRSADVPPPGAAHDSDLRLEPSRSTGTNWDRGGPNADPDPILAVDSFVARTRKETDESIKALNAESEALRARLAKVEAALQRWQAISNALPHAQATTGESLPTDPPSVDPGAKLPESRPSVDPVLSPLPPPGPPEVPFFPQVNKNYKS